MFSIKLNRLYEKVALISPWVEVFLRFLYWKNQRFFKKFNPYTPSKDKKNASSTYVNFDKVIEWLKNQGVTKGSLLIVHSSYDGLGCTGLSPDEIIDRLLDLVGNTGTLCMPVIRRYKEERMAEKKGLDISNVEITYNVRKTAVSSGILPYTLMHREDAVVSHHPYNPLCAVGPLAKEMMMHNLDGDSPSPHGPNSSWKFCVDHNVLICSIGTDLEHHNTTSHVVEEAYGNWRWSDEEWYDYRKFKIIDEGNNVIYKTVKKRKEKWGKIYLAEINSTHHGKKAGIFISDYIENQIQVGFIDSSLMVKDLMSRNKKGQPYYKLF